MIQLPLIHFDCKYFEGDKPCFANKQYGVFCSNCDYYEKDRSISGVFPEILQAEKTPTGTGRKNILIIKLDAVGDVLRTTSILPSLKKQLPHSSITWATKSKSFPVLENNIYINSIYLTEDNPDRILQGSFDIIINLDSSRESCEIMSKISSGERYGYTLVNGKPYPVNSFANEWYLMGVDDNSKKSNQKTYHKIIHEICGLKYTGTRPELEITEGKRIKAAHIREKSGLGNYGEFILINLGGGNRWQYKKWTKEGYAGLINNLALKKPNSAVGVIAGAEDEEFYNNVLLSVNRQDNVIPLGCRNSTEEFICIVYLADKIFTSDSLAFHIATALNKYVIVITGPTSHTELDVFGNGSIIYSAKVDCLTCYLNKCSKTVTCMNTVKPEEAVNYFL
jgi:ADP-heptose:LPS heptosyltransferase